jgi:hypothetical protein
MKRKFLHLVGSSFFVWIFTSLLSGIISGLAGFFTKQKLEKWKQNSSNKEEEL